MPNFSPAIPEPGDLARERLVEDLAYLLARSWIDQDISRVPRQHKPDVRTAGNRNGSIEPRRSDLSE